MAGYEGAEPSTRFCEIVKVGRKEAGRAIRPHDVTIFYKFKSGRGGRSRLRFSMVFTYLTQELHTLMSAFAWLFFVRV